MNKYAHIDQTDSPVIIIRFNSFEPTLPEFNEYLDDLKNLLSEKKITVQIYDASNSKYLSSQLRIRQGNWIKENNALIKQSTLGTAYIIPSAMARMMLNGIFLIQQPTVKYTVVATMEEAKEWAAKLIINQEIKV